MSRKRVLDLRALYLGAQACPRCERALYLALQMRCSVLDLRKRVLDVSKSLFRVPERLFQVRNTRQDKAGGLP